MLVRRLARPMLASIFITGGVDALRHPETKVPAASPLAPKIAAMLPIQLPQDTKQLVRMDAAVKVGAGTLLAVNRVPRVAAVALLASLVPTTLAGHPFWEEKDPKARASQQIQFVKNLSVAGGLLLAAVDTEGKPSVGWRARRAARLVAKASHRGGGSASKSTQKAFDSASRSTQKAVDSASKSTQKAVDSASKSTHKFLESATASGQDALSSASKSTGKVSRRAAKSTRKAAKSSAESARRAAESAAKSARKTAKQARKSDTAKALRTSAKQARKAVVDAVPALG